MREPPRRKPAISPKPIASAMSFRQAASSLKIKPAVSRSGAELEQGKGNVRKPSRGRRKAGYLGRGVDAAHGARSEERSVGKARVSTCSTRWSRYNYKTKNMNKQ